MNRFDAELAATVAAVVDEGAFDAAARRLRLTPSAVSQRVRLMEEQLGRVLLVRSRPVRATEAGEAVLRLARQIALLEHDAAASLGLDPDERDPRTRVALAVDADSLATWVLGPLTRTALERAFDLELLRADQSHTARLLESGRVMAAVTSETAAVAGCSTTWLGLLRYEAVGSPGFVEHWLAAGMTGDALARAPFVSFDREDALQAEWLAAHGVDPTSPPRHFVPSSHDLLRAVEAGLGWAMVPRPQAADALRSGTVVALAGDPVDVPLSWQQWSLRSPVLDALRSAVQAAAHSTLEQPPRPAIGRVAAEEGSVKPPA